MAYRKKYRRRKPTRKTKGANDKKVTVWSDHSVLEKANRALALVNNVRRFINVEVKRHDTTGNTTIPAGGTIIGLSDMAQGDGITNRDGDSVKLLNLTTRLDFRGSPASILATYVRVIIFRGKQEDQSGFSATEILESADHLSPKSWENRFKTKILQDRTYQLMDPEPTTGSYAGSKYVTMVTKLHGHVNYATGTTAIENGGLYCLFVTSATANQPTVDYYHRLTFTDN